MSQWREIAINYEIERDSVSLPALLIDAPIVAMVQSRLRPGSDILDFGAGSGTISRHLSRNGHHVTAYEPMPEMREVFSRKLADTGLEILLLDSLGDLGLPAAYECIVCSNVFDHLDDVPATLALFRRLLRPKGQLVLSIPHPMKNIGHWVKEGSLNNWIYLYYRLNDYLNEGTVKRDREDFNGNVIIRNVVSHHRTVATYFNWIQAAGFSVKAMTEPAPDDSVRDRFPALFAQCSRLPYFWLLDCVADD